MCDVTHSYVWHEWFNSNYNGGKHRSRLQILSALLRLIWFIYDLYALYVWHDKFYVWHDKFYVWHDKLIWMLYMCDMTNSMCDMTNSMFDMTNSYECFICVTLQIHYKFDKFIWQIHYRCDMTNEWMNALYMWHDKFKWHNGKRTCFSHFL